MFEDFKKFRTDKRLKKMELNLHGSSCYLPWGHLEDYCSEKIENLGNAGDLKFLVDGEYNSNNYIYKYKNELYLPCIIEHFNTELISVTFLKLIEIK